jgi:mannose/cellobiose epimerase-like protein (N-acyl-D-glucosamine 2-epimerase family)
LAVTSSLVFEMRQWMQHKALPLWSSVGLDRAHGGVLESLDLEAKGCAGEDFKRARVACPQLYVFSHAQVLGWPGTAAAADHVYADLVGRFWQGRGKGWVRRLIREGDILDPTPDLYDYAFALFALAWRYRATGQAEALALAHETLDILDARFAHASGAGFHHALPPALPRQQNPHMHLAEAALAWTEATGEQRFSALTDRLVQLVTERFVQRPTGCLPEFFDDAWTPMPRDCGQWVEPGHLFEWAWILAQHQRLRGADHSPVIRSLVTFAERFGVDPRTQVTFNRIDEDGAPLDRATRIWPNTERIKGWLGLFEVTGEDPWAAVAGSAELLLVEMLAKAPEGAWIDALDEEGRPAARTIPTSTLYHLFLAFSEVLRLAPKATNA